jgi:peptidyl-prolyl cis-trans isomerase A (cyclophilin A)
MIPPRAAATRNFVDSTMHRRTFFLAACDLFLGILLASAVGCGHSADGSADTAEAGSENDRGDGATPAGAERLAKPRTRPSADYYPAIVLKTSHGELTVELDPNTAPRTVNNFLHYVESGHYNQTIFHQVDAGYVALGGGYTPELTEKRARYPIPNEAANGRKNLRGTIAMAREPETIDSSTCQFFINLADNPQLDHRGDGPEEYGYCVFGKVIEGMEVLDRIAQVEVRDADEFPKLPVETVLIESAYRLR